MARMTREKQQRRDEIAADRAELERIDHTISTHLQPNLVRVCLWRAVKQHTAAAVRRGARCILQGACEPAHMFLSLAESWRVSAALCFAHRCCCPQDRLSRSIQQKTDMRDNLRRQLGQQTKNLQDMQSQAAALIQSARSRTTKLMVRWWGGKGEEEGKGAREPLAR